MKYQSIRAYRQFALFLASFISCASLAAPMHQEAAITVNSDSAEYNHKTGVATHRGNVILEQGNRQVSADVLSLYRDKDGEIESFLAEGNPAQYRFIPSGNMTPITGSAESIRYYPKNGELLLNGKALLQHEDDILKGPSIRYNIDQETVMTAPNREGRTTLVIQPSTQNNLKSKNKKTP